MIAYVDSSVPLRVVLRQPNELAEWTTIQRGIVSALVEPECLRTIDRARGRGALPLDESLRIRETVMHAIQAMHVIDLAPAVLRRAGQSIPIPLGVLDAIHLASAQLWRDASGEELVFATHDRMLALAARASGFVVLGS